MLTFLIGFSLCLQPVICLTLDSDVDRLIHDLRANYSKYARPLRNQKLPFTVEVSFSLYGIREFDEVKNKLSVIGNAVIAWQDDRLAWEPNHYNDIESFLVDNDVFWTPPIYLQNSMEEMKKIGHDSYWTVRYYPFGFAVFYPGNTFSANCKADVRYFPWDEQRCSLSFGLIGYIPSEIILKPHENEFIKPLQWFYGDGIWDVKSREMTSTDQNTVQVIYKMKRKPLQAIVNIILPIMLMSFLNVIVFLTPAETGERISFCLTVLLAIAVFMTLVSDSMPKSATSIAYLSYYLASVLVLSILITVGTIVSSKFYHHDNEQEVPHCLQSCVRCLLCKKRSPRHRGNYTRNLEPDSYTNDKTKHSSLPEERLARKSKDYVVQRNIPEIPYIHADVTSFDYVVSNQSRLPSQTGSRTIYPHEQNSVNQSRDSKDKFIDQSEETITWKHVSYAFDRVFFIFSCSLIIGFTLVYFIIASS